MAGAGVIGIRTTRGGYTTWAWTAGFNDATRKWTHTATNAGAGDVFDHGQKWEAFTCVP